MIISQANPSRAELLLKAKSSSKGYLEGAGSPPKIIMGNLGQVSYSLPLGYMGNISILLPYRNIKNKIRKAIKVVCTSWTFSIMKFLLDKDQMTIDLFSLVMSDST